MNRPDGDGAVQPRFLSSSSSLQFVRGDLRYTTANQKSSDLSNLSSRSEVQARPARPSLVISTGGPGNAWSEVERSGGRRRGGGIASAAGRDGGRSPGNGARWSDHATKARASASPRPCAPSNSHRPQAADAQTSPARDPRPAGACRVRPSQLLLTPCLTPCENSSPSLRRQPCPENLMPNCAELPTQVDCLEPDCLLQLDASSFLPLALQKLPWYHVLGSRVWTRPLRENLWRSVSTVWGIDGWRFPFWPS